MRSLYGSTGVASVMQMVREATRASASALLNFYLTRTEWMKMIRRGSKANEHVIAVGEATEGGKHKNIEEAFSRGKGWYRFAEIKKYGS